MAEIITQKPRFCIPYFVGKLMPSLLIIEAQLGAEHYLRSLESYGSPKSYFHHISCDPARIQYEGNYYDGHNVGIIKSNRFDLTDATSTTTNHFIFVCNRFLLDNFGNKLNTQSRI